jgi:hypothetical protein
MLGLQGILVLERWSYRFYLYSRHVLPFIRADSAKGKIFNVKTGERVGLGPLSSQSNGGSSYGILPSSKPRRHAVDTGVSLL